ncbi:MAG: DNA mismatch repair protein MutS [Gemmatimonadota bacterium]
MSLEEPAAEYRQRLAQRKADLAHAMARERIYGHVRLTVFLTGATLAWLFAGPKLLSPAWLILPLLGFIVLMVGHSRTTRRREVLERAVSFYQEGLDRLAGTWPGRGDGGRRFSDPEHPYARDLDLFGPDSLFALLNVTRTRTGEERLAGWLLSAAEPHVVRARQAAVEELRSKLDLREDLAVLGADLAASVDTETLAEWSRAPTVLTEPRLPWVAGFCSLFTVSMIVAWFVPAISTGGIPLLTALALQTVVARVYRGRASTVIARVSHPAEELEVLATLLARFEAEQFESPLLVSLRERLITESRPPSERIASLGRLREMLDSRRNQLFAPVAAVLMWGTQFAAAIERWRSRYGAAVPVWLETVAQLESLSALAGYAYEHPGDPFPELVEKGPRFEGQGLGHPLLHSGCVDNDVRLNTDQALWIVSGSNMSGKSTFLRTIGVNAVLAQAGGPVRANRLTMSALAIGATLRVEDSLHKGASRFYAEISRLRSLVSIADESPPALLFLLDEILHGTNSHDRLIGAEAVVRGLLERGAIGLVTTHDLALSKIADELSPRAANVHFADHLENGEIRFDYLVREGVVRKSNALELMRSIGLKV